MQVRTAGTVHGPARPVTRSRHRSLAALLVLAAVTAAVSVSFWPGHMNLNTLTNYDQAASGRYWDWDSAIWTAIWRVLLLVHLRSPGWMLAAVVMLQLVGVYLLLRTRLSRPAALIGATGVLVFPPVLTFSIVIGTGVWFAASIVAGFGFASLVARTRGTQRVASAVLAIGCGFLAQAARPTALPAVLLLVGAVAFVLIGPELRSWRRVLAAGAAAVVGAVLIYGSVAGVTRFVLHATAARPEQVTYDYDLVTLSVREHEVLLPADIYPRQDVAYLTGFANGRAGILDITALLWGNASAITLMQGQNATDGQKVAELEGAWLAAIREHPYGWLQVRLHSALWQLGIAGPEFGVYYDTPPSTWFGPPLLPGVTQRALAYSEVGTGTRDPAGGPLQAVWVYLALLAGGVAVLFGGRRPADVVLALFGLALLLYATEVLVVSPGVTYRFMHPAVMAGTLLAIVVAASAWNRLRARIVPRVRHPQPAHGRATDSAAGSR